MTVRWITERLGTSGWRHDLVAGPYSIVDVRPLRDAAGNAPALIREKIAEVRDHLGRGARIVVCCDYGISRSNAIVAAVLAEETGLSLGEGLRRVVEATGETGIKIDFVDDLRRALGDKLPAAKATETLILGREGFIGRALVERIAPVDASAPDQALLDNPVLLDAAMDESGAGRIVFCWHPPGLDTNRAAGQLITALRNALEVCRVRQARLVFLSGLQVFAGRAGDGPVDVCESDPPQPAGAAGDGLFLAETLVGQYAVRHGIANLLVRVPHVYGEGDERPGIVNTLVRKALAGQRIVTHRYRNGAPRIDLIHVSDLARAMSLAVEQDWTGVLHIASGKPVATDDLARLVVGMAGSKSEVSCVELPGAYHMVRLRSTREPAWKPAIELVTGLSNLIAHTRSGAL